MAVVRMRGLISVDETWRGEAEVEEPPVVAGLAGEAASPLAASSHCGVYQPQDEPGQKELAVAQPEGARADWDVPLHLLRGATLLGYRIEVIGRGQPPTVRAGIEEGVITQVVIRVGNQNIEDDTSPQFMHILFRIGAISAQSIDKFQVTA